MKKTMIKNILQTGEVHNSYHVSGWVRNKRSSKEVSFIMLNDGSSLNDLQIIVEINSENEVLLKQVTTGSSISVYGSLIESKGSGQSVELLADQITVIGSANPDEYPIQPKKHTFDFLRKNAHLRFRTKTFSTVFRIRHGLSFAIHQFFNQRGF